MHCTTILEGSADGFIFDTGGKSTQLISIRNGHFRYVYMGGVMMSGMIPENGGKWEREKGAELASVTKNQGVLMKELGFRRERESSHG